ncbi:MAG: NAD(P)-binding protein [Azoarcus sp.]|nr:NAD(P)-binding protein [Azoarcus sp.]
MKRRDFLAGCGAAGLAGALPGCAPAPPALPPGELARGGLDAGHRVRAGGFPPPVEEIDVPVLIVGAGIGGLSAAWRLCRNEAEFGAARNPLAILELEDRPGGNARYGENAICRYPLGAHYLPLPNQEARAVRALLAELGVLRGAADAPRPEYDERYLCHAPQERLYRYGLWQEGLLPRLGVPTGELEQQERFFARMAQFRDARDASGRRAFALPLAYCGDAPEWAALDRLAMRDWMLGEGFDAPSLHWYVDYACRDDYGTGHDKVSAWAGVHYFACRAGWGGEAGEAVLTAPEGNGWLVDGLQRQIARSPGAVSFHSGQAVYALRQSSGGCEVEAWDRARGVSLRYRARHIIWAAPLFLLPHVASALPADLAKDIAAVSHAPWLVANLSLKAPPAPGAGAELAWDNVLQDGEGLGYVVATHQRIRQAPAPTVLTYYRAFPELAPAAARQLLLERTREEWARTVLAELAHAHHDIHDLVTRLDVFRHGHAMARPLPGFRDRTRRLEAGWGRVRFAHADVSGLSLFEEANYRGVRAAEDVLAASGHLRTRLT